MTHRYTAILLILILAALVRGLCLSSELWFDEIWSWDFARRADSAFDLLLGSSFHHDNNHKLNTLYLFFLADGLPWWVYRLHSFLAGLGVTALAMQITSRTSGRTPAVLIAGLLVATNFWLVLAATEARGYSLAALFALTAYVGLKYYLEQRSWWGLFGYWLATALGLLAHLTFLQASLALGLWSIVVSSREHTTSRGQLVELLRCQLVPVLFFVFLYLVDIRHLELGGGPARSLGDVLGNLLSVGVGMPFLGPFLYLLWPVFLVVTLLTVVLGVRLLNSSEGQLGPAGPAEPSGVFFVLMVLVAPTLFLARGAEVLFERYLLLPWMFFLLLTAILLGICWQRARLLGRLSIVAVVVLMVVGNLWEVACVVRQGRGQFLEVLAYLAEHDSSPEIVVTAPDEGSVFRTTRFLAFFASYDPSRRTYRWSALNDPELPRWMLIHWYNSDLPAEDRIFVEDRLDYHYQRVASWPLSNRAGWSWYVYEKRRN